ncbi:MAG TPA: DUF732 domain-containing protein [Mycobacterium sp.]|nr:DUF732 domain-containing protein [Mycobacterium sp.]HTX95940.1 DUF732 domain-containing protein [Mycobacterium sp.]
MKLLLVVASFAAVIGMAAPAHADSTDDSFLASLQAASITYNDPDKAVAAGKWVCDQVNGGTQMPDVVKTLLSKNANLSDEKANKFAAIAASSYCPGAISSTTTSTPPETPTAT